MRFAKTLGECPEYACNFCQVLMADLTSDFNVLYPRLCSMELTLAGRS
jgi:hypothetical protein